MLLNYATYQDLGGKIAEDDFDAHIAQAESYLNYYTQNRISTPTRSVQEALKAIVDLIEEDSKEFTALKETQAVHGAIKAQAAGQTRIEYSDPGRADILSWDKRQEVLEKSIYKIVKRWLGLTGLMYRGR